MTVVDLLMESLRVLFNTLIGVLILPLRLMRSLINQGNTYSSESYSHLDHLALNTLPPVTEWLNMGYWDHTTEFPTACCDLALQLYEVAGLRKDASILDVGHGSGDSLLLLTEKFSPRSLTGITSLPSHARRAKERLGPKAKIICDDAVHYVEMLADPNDTTPKQSFDSILALDCAYHFNTRWRFFKAAKQLLEPGGTLALVDLVLSTPYPDQLQPHKGLQITTSPLPRPKLSQLSIYSSIKHNLICRLAFVPPKHLVPIEEYATRLESYGYTNVYITDISHNVFPGFSNFLAGLGKRGDEAAWRGGSWMQLAALRAFSNVTGSWARGGDKGTVRCIIVKASSDSVPS